MFGITEILGIIRNHPEWFGPNQKKEPILPLKEVLEFNKNHFARYGCIVKHFDHQHRSKEEVLVCEWLKLNYGVENVQANYRIPKKIKTNRGRQYYEIDFAIMQNGVVGFFLEYHPYKLPRDIDYARNRTELIRSLYGDVRVIIMEKLPKELYDIYYKKSSLAALLLS